MKNLSPPPVKTPVVSNNNQLHPFWLNYFAQTHAYMRSNLSQQGFVTPIVTTDQQTLMTPANGTEMVKDTGGGVYVKQIYINGAWYNYNLTEA